MEQETLFEIILFSGGCRRLAATSGIMVLLILIGGGLVATAGPHWQGIAQANEHPLAILLDPLVPQTIYAGTEQQGVLVSHDGGSTWRAFHAGLPTDAVVTALAQTPDGTLLAGTNHGVFVSSDGGQTWRARGTGLPANTTVDAIVQGSNDGHILLLGGTAGIFRSTDAGVTWAVSMQGLSTQLAVYSLLAWPAAHSVYAGFIGAGVAVSHDAGITWQISNHGLPPDVTVFAIAPAANRLYVGTTTGVFRSDDSGTSWIASSNGLGTTRAITLAVDPHNAHHLVVGTDNGVFASSDRGATWNHLGNLRLPDEQSIGVVALAYPAGSSPIVFAAGDRMYRYPGTVSHVEQTLRILGMALVVALLLGLVGLARQHYRSNQR